METNKKIVQWAEKLQYKKVVPDEIKNICNNPATAFLWEQLVTKVIPKQEVDYVRRNILLNRVKNLKKLERHNPNQTHVREIDLWKKKERLSKDINVLEENIAEKEEQLKDLTKCVDQKCVQYKGAKLQVKENEEKQFLYERKSEQLKADIVRSEEKLFFFRNLTPVEEAQSKQDIAETLKKCAEKIQCVLDEEKTEKNFLTVDDAWLTPQKKPTMSAHSFFDDGCHKFTRNKLSKNRLADEIKCFRDVQLSKDISKILHENNVGMIWSVFLERIDRKQWQIEEIMSRRKLHTPALGNNVSEALCKLRAVHIGNELKSLKYESEIQKMNTILDRLQDETYSKFEALNLPSANMEEMRDIFSLQRREIGLTAFCNCMHQQLELMQADLSIKLELNNCKIKCMDIQEELIKKLRSLTSRVGFLEKIYHAILLCQDDTAAVVKKLSQFTQDLKWTLALTDDLHSREVKVFLRFPLEYNRQLNVHGKRVFARNILRDISADLENVDQQTFQTIMKLVESPHRAPENLICQLLQSKRKLKIQQELCADSSGIPPNDMPSTEELQSGENYVLEAVEKLQAVLKDTLHSAAEYSTLQLNELMNLWIEMPFGEQLSAKRLFNRNDLMHYQKLFDSCYDRL